jgi:hypothetical protein
MHEFVVSPQILKYTPPKNAGTELAQHMTLRKPRAGLAPEPTGPDWCIFSSFRSTSFNAGAIPRLSRFGSDHRTPNTEHSLNCVFVSRLYHSRAQRPRMPEYILGAGVSIPVTSINKRPTTSPIWGLFKFNCAPIKAPILIYFHGRLQYCGTATPRSPAIVVMSGKYLCCQLVMNGTGDATHKDSLTRFARYRKFGLGT